jgi:enoyl-CoA hydratase/carnithine racemase
MTPNPIRLEREGDVAVLYLDAPPRNVMDGPFFEALTSVARDVLPGLAAKGLVVRGRGRHFSAGADVSALRQRARPGDPERLAEFEENGGAFTAIERLPYPTIAAVDGACLGSGLELALACRWRLATPSVLMASPEAEFGLIPGCGCTVRLPQRIGVGAALDLMLTARYVDATEALELGLVDAVVPREELGAAAARWILRLDAADGRGA